MTNRRTFLRNLGFTGSLIAMPSVLVHAKPVLKRENIDLSVRTLQGMVHSKGKGIANVAVTDGINSTLTDKNGRYELVSNTTAEFVYISVPAGYTFPAEKGIAA